MKLQKAQIQIIIRTIWLSLFVILCAGTLFAESHSFVDPQITPKWYLFYIVNGIIIFFYIIKKYICNKLLIKEMSNKAVFLGIISISCTIQAVYALAQYSGLFYINMQGFITGSFDNPAGLAGCLVVGLPSLFYFRSYNKFIKRSMWLSIGVIFSAIILSGSRAGIFTLIGLFLVTSIHFLHLTPRLRKIILIGIPSLLILILISLYYIKKDSSDGRFLIWRCSLEMIKDKPLLGHGYGAFNAKYMLYQASYLEKYPNCRYSQLADNVKHPFNEFLLVTVEYGMLGLIITIAFFVLAWSIYHKNKQEHFISLLSYGAIALFSCFSYPFLYPFIWVIFIFFSYYLFRCKFPSVPSYVRTASLVLTLFACIFMEIRVMQSLEHEREWHKIATKSLFGKTLEMLPQYEVLKSKMNDNFLFLYNYAAELNHAKQYKKSIGVLRECMKGYIDYDVQLLLADNFKKTNQWEQAETSYQIAANMCPNRFTPLYQLVKIYQMQQNEDKVKTLTSTILTKTVKIPSDKIDNMKQDLEYYIRKKH